MTHHEDDVDVCSSNVSLSHTSESGAVSTTKDRVQKEMQSSIAEKEDRMVFIVRVLVLVAVICSTVAVSVAVYYFATANDNTNFELEVRIRLMRLCTT